MQEKQIEKVFKALANRRRLAILKLLKKQSQTPVRDIAEEIKLSFKATSKHLCILYAAELVEREQVSLTVNYSLSQDLQPAIRQVISLL